MSLGKDFRKNGLQSIAKKAAHLRKSHTSLPKDPQKVLKQRIYEDFLKGFDNDKH